MVPVTEKWALTGAIYNGWNQPTDLNQKKTMSLQSAYLSDNWLWNVLYIGGAERPKGIGTGEPWRNLFDTVVQWTGLPRLHFAGQANGGWETNHIGTNKWYGLGGWARAELMPWLFLALRADGIREFGTAAKQVPLFFGSGHIVSGTATLDFRPVGDGFTIRLEYRHDGSDKKNPLFYTHGLNTDGSQRLAATQNTLTLGVSGWF
jgi:hypothetical protein